MVLGELTILALSPRAFDAAFVPQTRVFETPRPGPLREVGFLVAVVAELSVTINVSKLGVCHGFWVLSPGWLLGCPGSPVEWCVALWVRGRMA